MGHSSFSHGPGVGGGGGGSKLSVKNRTRDASRDDIRCVTAGGDHVVLLPYRICSSFLVLTPLCRGHYRGKLVHQPR